MSARDDAEKALEEFDQPGRVAWDTAEKVADALRALLAETEAEWEYATAIKDTKDGGPHDIFGCDEPMSERAILEWIEEDRVGWMNFPPERTLVNLRRTREVPAGPWEEVPE